jgi:hypothetical protein
MESEKSRLDQVRIGLLDAKRKIYTRATCGERGSMLDSESWTNGITERDRAS